jgi:hypothetical protein
MGRKHACSAFVSAFPGSNTGERFLAWWWSWAIALGDGLTRSADGGRGSSSPAPQLKVSSSLHGLTENLHVGSTYIVSVHHGRIRIGLPSGLAYTSGSPTLPSAMFILVNKQCAVNGSFVFRTILCALDPDTANFPPILLPSKVVAKLPVQGPAARMTVSASTISSPFSVLILILFGVWIVTSRA